ncbi:hypothetical protein [Streptomyces iconiensis]|uniref:Uncharacterized protein n=1 Tax=Streptomyces iconiensis TaxID=1384038 RepID=A0ABT7A100_9ACTN|nr:hypothetical protein [Streptomyces iconiensis]MDJ1134516.1 hypothetical protein [Streptomyces iconiensis]
MHEQAKSASGLVSVEYRSFLLAEPGTSGRSAPEHYANGLVFTTTPGETVILTGIASGDVTVNLEIRRQPPDTVDLDPWDEVVDHSLVAPIGEVRVLCVDDVPPDFPVLSQQGPGSYRVRVHARGRDTAPDGVTFEPVEEYHLTVWPAPAAPDHVHKQTDSVGASWRRAAQRPTPQSPPPDALPSTPPAKSSGPHPPPER